MYGTVARMQVKPGFETQFSQITQEIGIGKAPGQVGVVVYQMDADPLQFYLAVMFESREAYVANANSSEQHARFMQLMAVLAHEPEWHDGDIVYHVL